jgi:heat shock protein HslJ
MILITKYKNHSLVNKSLVFFLFLLVISCSAGKPGMQKNKEAVKNKVAVDQKITDKYWKLIELSGNKITMNGIHHDDAHFIIQADTNRVIGYGGCNSFNGNCILSDGNKIRFSKLLSTKMACSNLDIENEFFKVLESADNYSLTGDTLSLNKSGMNALAKFVTVQEIK